MKRPLDSRQLRIARGRLDRIRNARLARLSGQCMPRPGRCETPYRRICKCAGGPTMKGSWGRLRWYSAPLLLGCDYIPDPRTMGWSGEAWGLRCYALDRDECDRRYGLRYAYCPYDVTPVTHELPIKGLS